MYGYGISTTVDDVGHNAGNLILVDLPEISIIVSVLVGDPTLSFSSDVCLCVFTLLRRRSSRHWLMGSSQAHPVRSNVRQNDEAEWTTIDELDIRCD